MKRAYRTPTAKLVDFQYDEQVQARSGDVCYGVIWRGTATQHYCTNPEDHYGGWWNGENDYNNPPQIQPFAL